MSDRASFDANGVQFAWNASSVSVAEACLRKYQYSIIEGWSAADKSVHLLFGGWYASALERYHKLRAQGMEYDDAVIQVVSNTMTDTWEHDCVPENAGRCFDPQGCDDPTCPDFSGYEGLAPGDRIPGTGYPWNSLHNTKTRENLIRTIVWYLDQFADDNASTVILSDGSAAVELSFAIPVDSTIIFAGHLDRLVSYAGHIYVQDQKTTGSTISARYFEGYSPDTQMSMYTWAGKSIFSSPVHGVMIDGAQIAVGFTRFERGFAFRNEAQLDEWFDDTMYHIEMARAATKEGYFPQNRASCSNYGGCEFRAICSRAPSVREQFLKGDYVKARRLDPLDRR